MMKITVCIGSSCHIKGSRQVVEQLQYLIAENNLGDKVELGGTFCKKSDTAKQYVQKWMPIVAASQSVKGNEHEREFLASWVGVVDYQ